MSSKILPVATSQIDRKMFPALQYSEVIPWGRQPQFLRKPVPRLELTNFTLLCPNKVARWCWMHDRYRTLVCRLRDWRLLVVLDGRDPNDWTKVGGLRLTCGCLDSSSKRTEVLVFFFLHDGTKPRKGRYGQKEDTTQRKGSLGSFLSSRGLYAHSVLRIIILNRPVFGKPAKG